MQAKNVSGNQALIARFVLSTHLWIIYSGSWNTAIIAQTASYYAVTTLAGGLYNHVRVCYRYSSQDKLSNVIRF